MFWPVFSVYALACAGFCGYVASQKNRSGGAWFFFGLFFGVFALIAIAAVPSIGQSSSSPTTGEKQCSNCGAFNRPDAGACYSCSHPL